MTEHILTEKRQNIQIITINRPEKKNALTENMYNAMTDAFYAGEADDEVRVHVLAGAEGVFTGGNDVMDFFKQTQSDNPVIQGAGRFIEGQFEWKKPVIAAVDGLAVGIGSTLLLHCDLVYCSERSKFTTPFAGLGLTPENGSSATFPRTMGYQRAFEMLCLGTAFDAQRAKEAGFVNEVVPHEELLEYTLNIAKQLASKPPEAIKNAKELLKRGHADLVSVITEEFEYFSRGLKSNEAKEAFMAFLSKK